MIHVYKILEAAEWAAAAAAGGYDGSAVDLADGFIHLSTALQAPETARRHFAGRENLVIVGFSAERLGEALRLEPSRGGARFPHHYGRLDPALAVFHAPLPLGADGAHVFPALAP